LCFLTCEANALGVADQVVVTEITLYFQKFGARLVRKEIVQKVDALRARYHPLAPSDGS